MGNQMVMHPRGLPLWGTENIAAATWAAHTQFKISAASGSGGLALPFIGDGTAVKTVKVRIYDGSQAGTLHCSIQSPSATPDVNNVSGLPDGTAITNGTAGTASITGAVHEVVTLTFATAPTPTGLHWIVLEGSSGGTIDIEIGYSADWTNRNNWWGRQLSCVYHDGVDWNNQTTVGAPGISAFDGSGNMLQPVLQNGPPVVSSNTNLFEAITADNKECIGVKFTAKDNLTSLLGMNYMSSTMGIDMNYVMKIAKADGTVIATSSTFNQQVVGASSRQLCTLFNNHVTLVSGTTYRLFLMNPEDTADDVSMLYLDATAADQVTYFNLDSGEFALCTATDPPEYGAAGSGTWTDEPDKMPVINLLFDMDVSAVGGGGGGAASRVGYVG